MKSEFLLQSGQKIVFVGDSITEPADGYVGMVEHMIGALRPDLSITYVNKGIAGNKVTELIARAETDFVAQDPDWITISIGINDCEHVDDVGGIPVSEFKKVYYELVDLLQARTRAKLALCTTTVIGEDLDCAMNGRLAAYNDVIRQLASEKGALLVEMNKAFHEAIAAWRTIGDGLRFTSDTVHMSPEGNYLVALTLLRAWGLL